MTRIDFYFNAPGKAEVARKLAAKTFQSGQQALVYSRKPNHSQELDGVFWTAQQLSFLPHVRCGHPLARQTPILIGENPDELSSADVLINLEDETPDFFSRFARVMEIVTTEEADRERASWSAAFFKERGYQVDTHDLGGGKMSSENPDLFGKIDALLGKRAPDALLDKGLEFEDFPLLTEVVDPAREALSEVERRAQERRQFERRELDRRLGDRRQDGRRAGDHHDANPPPALPSDMSAEMERLVVAMERRLTDMFIRQQLRMEEAVRKAIRDELDKNPGKQRNEDP